MVFLPLTQRHLTVLTRLSVTPAGIEIGISLAIRVPMILSAFFFNPQGDHRMSWRHRRAPGQEIFRLEYYRQLAIAAENAVMDMVFVADHVAISDSFQSTVALPKWWNWRIFGSSIIQLYMAQIDKPS